MMIKEKYSHLIIDNSETLIAALKKMDNERVKLLIVFDSGKYKSLLSIGDIQRAIISGKSIQEEKINTIERHDIVCSTSDNKEVIKKRMVEIRAQFMPILDENDNLANIYLWDDIFSEKFDFNNFEKKNFEIPVVIMAGGEGSRLRPLTNIIPKPLIPIGKKTILEKIIDNFCASGFYTFYVSINYKSHMIESYFKNLEVKNYDLHFFKEDEPKGTAGSLSLIRDKINTPFFVSNCDILIEQDYNEVFAYHQEQKNDITAIAAVKNFKLPYGSFEMNKQGVITNILEKPEFTFYVNAGMYIIEPHLLEEIPDSGIFHITELITGTMKKGGKVGIFPVSEKSWIDIGDWNLYEKLLKE